MSQIIDLESRRSLRRDALAGNHRTRVHYDDVVELLADARRVVSDLDRPEQLLVPVSELEFTIRRLRALLTGAERRLTNPATPHHQQEN